MDEFVHVAVMGVGMLGEHTMRLDCQPEDVPHYSTDIAAAFEVVEKLNLLQFELSRENCSGVRWDAICYDDLEQDVIWRVSCVDTAAEAICRVALLAKDVEVPE